jgi:hypothetical protein
MLKKNIVLNTSGSQSVEVFFKSKNTTTNKYTKCSDITENALETTLLELDNEEKRRGRKKKSKIYFPKETENAIVEYINETDNIKKQALYNDIIKYSFEKLAENMINTFSFSYIESTYKDLKHEVVSHMFLNITKYQQPKGKAFSYFGQMAKNYLIIENNNAYDAKKITKSIQSEENSDTYDFDIIDDSHEHDLKSNETKEFIKLMVEYWEVNIPYIFKKKRDIDIAISINELLKNASDLDYFNKKALYLLIREMSGHKTQYITKVIKKLMSHYSEVKNQYYATGNIDCNKYITLKSARKKT